MWTFTRGYIRFTMFMLEKWWFWISWETLWKSNSMENGDLLTMVVLSPGVDPPKNDTHSLGLDMILSTIDGYVVIEFQTD